MHKLLSVLLAAVSTTAFAETYRITVIPKSVNAPYWEIIHGGVEKARAELKKEGDDVVIQWVGPASEEDVAGQVQLVQDAIKNKAQGILLAPSSTSALAVPVKAATEAGIPTCIIDSGLKAAGQITFIATDNYKGGVLGARRIGGLLEGKGKVVLLRAQKGGGATDAREQGFLDTIKNQYPNIQILNSDQYAGGSYESAEKVGAELISKVGKETNAIFASNDISNHGALKALKDAGLAGGKVKLVGFDASSETLAALKSGDIQGTVVQNPVLMGYIGVKSLIAHLKGKPVEREIDTGCVLVTPDNLDKPAVVKLIGGKTSS